MISGYRNVLLAALGWLSLCGAQSPADQAKSNHSGRKAVSAQNTIAAPTPTRPASVSEDFTAYTGYNPDPCYHAQKDAADLCAQWRAAIAGEKAAHEARRATTWAIVATILSAFGVLGLLHTIRENYRSRGETERALDAAELSANAASEQAKIAQRNGVIQLRPYVLVDYTEILFDETGASLVRIIFKNSGQTPAVGLRTNVMEKCLPAGEEPIFGEVTLDETSKFSIGAGATRRKKVGPWRPEPTQAMIDGDITLFIWGRGEYEDVLGNKYWFTFRAQAGGGYGFRQGDALIIPDEGNDEGFIEMGPHQNN